MTRSTQVTQIDGHDLTLSNLDKVLYPKAHFTKAHVIDYYRRIAPVLLPHLQGRAITLKRYPDGVEGPFFYEKQAPRHRPDWLETTRVQGSTKAIDYCVIDTLPALVWAANLADLELHTFLARATVDPHVPTMMVVDLDPGAPADIIDCCDVALWLRDALGSLGLRSFAKTSGQKGMQLYVPLNTPTTFEETKPFARALGEIIEQEHPQRVTTKMSKAERPGKVFIDWSQNDDHKTTVCVYSLRATPLPSVSMPLEWHEVDDAAQRRDAKRLRFTPQQALARVAGRGDLFAELLTLEQMLHMLVSENVTRPHPRAS